MTDEPTSGVEAVLANLCNAVMADISEAKRRLDADIPKDAPLHPVSAFLTGMALHVGKARAALVPPAASPATHPDDLAVDRFAAAMKAKLAKKRKQGRRGWDDKTECTNARLVTLLCEHVAKGDPVDVGNLAMMIHQRGERICT